MQTLPKKTQKSLHKRWGTIGAIAGVVGFGGLLSFAVIGQSGPPNIQKLNISSVPLYAATQGDKPALALALSVEFPTVGAQYVDAPNTTIDSSYSPEKEYIGYYHAEMCYSYLNNPSEAPVAGKTSADYKRFVISGPASARRCADAFSGNFLNWASNSAIDMLRLALSGGDRVIDEENLTILQRAVIPNGDPTCFWNSTNFPAKELKADSGNYFGAVPKAMVKAAGNKSVWIANTLNRIYFGSTIGGSCAAPGGYNLTATTSGYQMGPLSAVLPGNEFSGTATSCAGENGSCSVGGTTKLIWYGAPGKGWVNAPVTGTVSCTNGVFGDPAPGTTKRCYVADYSGSWKPPALGSDYLNSDGFFYSRVEVCNKDNSGDLKDVRDYRFCEKYPNGNYKPIGTVQHYSNQLRLAAFGYALEQTASYNNGRFGGVLRAPMKYVGPKKYDENGVDAGANANAEWDDRTGIFKTNPDGDTKFGTSGVINYLNHFGRTGAKPGRYKRYDPASELYYETLRYLQGHPPSADAISNLTDEMYDGFPIYTDWTHLDPFSNRSKDTDYSCLKTNIALVGDVNTHDGSVARMQAHDAANNFPDINHWIDVVNGFERRQSVSYLDGQGHPQTTQNPTSIGGVPSSGRALYGLAYWANTHDIRGKGWTANPGKQRPGLRVKSFLFDVNEYGLETPNNKRWTNNQYYTAAKYGGFNTQPNKDNSIPFNVKGNPFYDQNGNPNNYVWQDPLDPRFPGRVMEPHNYFLQSDARGVLAAFEKIFGNAAGEANSIADTAASGSSITSSELYQYQLSFDTRNWSGDVKAFAIKSENGQPKLDAMPVWSAEQKLRVKPIVSRKIFVGKQRSQDVPNPSETATEFTTSAIEKSLQEMLNRPSNGAAEDGLWKARVDYLRGANVKEGEGVDNFRRRERALGDITNSGIQYTGAPSAALTLGEGYDAHVIARKDRTAAVYVGANDGMMHAFNAKTGDELFAYIPSWMGPKLSALTDKKYAHQSYVDATPIVGDAKIGDGATKDDWRTVLVSGTGGGGKGVFALDVSDPDNFKADNVMWEFTHVNDPDMGYVIGKSRIVKMHVKHKTSDSNSKDVYRWFALVPAGANNYVDTGDGIFSQTGKAAIFLLALDKKVNEAWEQGKNYYKISLPFDPALGQTRATAVISLESFTSNAQGAIDLVYAGDLHGNMWALKFSGIDASATNWTANGLSRYKNNNGVAIPMYVSKDGDGNIQSITSAPSILRIGMTDNYMVGFGTGKYIEEADRGSKSVNTYYVIYDNGINDASGSLPAAAWPVAIDGRGRLRKVARSGFDLAVEGAVGGFQFGRPATDANNALRSGWYYDFEETGERIVSDGTAIPFTSSVLVNSIIPAASSAETGVCGLEGGTSRGYRFNYFETTGTLRITTTVMTGKPLMFTEVTDLGKADSTGRRLRKVVPYTSNPGLGIKAEEAFYIPVGRLSWRQVNNYLELRSQQ